MSLSEDMKTNGLISQLVQRISSIEEFIRKHEVVLHSTGSNTGDVTLGNFGSTPSAQAASLSGQVLTLQPASASFPGGVSTVSQAFSGDKNFSDSISIGNSSPPTRLGQKLSVDTVSNFGGLALTTWSASNNGPILDFNSSRANSVGTHTIVANGNFLGVLDFRGSDGTQFINGVRIIASVDGIPGLNDMPGKLGVLTTPDGSATSVERLTIRASGNVGIANTNPLFTLDITGTLNVTGKTTVGAPVNLKNYTVATLPAGVRGDVAYVTDALGPTFLVAVVGGGAVVAPVFYNGANWVAF